MKSEKYIDFHAHHPSLSGEKVIQDGIDTRGRHPWYLSSAPPNLPTTSSERMGEFLAIGESGLDRLCETPYDLQLRVFREEVALSEELQKPLILHCVRAIDDVLRIRKELHARQPIIWHGYRGNAKQLLQLLQTPNGAFYFSFGMKFNTEALLACPPNRLLLETDDDPRPIATLYDQVATLLRMSTNNLSHQMHQNFHTLFE